MKIELPKDLRTFAFTDLTLIELNDTDVERMLTQIFEMAVKRGRTASNVSSAKTYDEKRKALSKNGRLEGFQGDRGEAVLDGWLRASVVEMGRVGRSRASEQMQFIRPSTVAVFRAGFPSRSRHRRADKLVYTEMMEEAKRRLPSADESMAAVWISDQFVKSFGQGVTFSDPPKWAPTYDGSTKVDISALLALYFLGISREAGCG